MMTCINIHHTARVIMQLSSAIVDFYLFYDGLVGT